jgi:hypothetical protein
MTKRLKSAYLSPNWQWIQVSVHNVEATKYEAVCHRRHSVVRLNKGQSNVELIKRSKTALKRKLRADWICRKPATIHSKIVGPILLLLLLLWLYSPLLGLGLFFSFLIIYTDGRTPWTSDQPVARPLPTHTTTQTQNKGTQYRHPCLEWDSNPRSQRSS